MQFIEFTDLTTKKHIIRMKGKLTQALYSLLVFFVREDPSSSILYELIRFRMRLRIRIQNRYHGGAHYDHPWLVVSGLIILGLEGVTCYSRLSQF
jgi:hypothetical protein